MPEPWWIDLQKLLGYGAKSWSNTNVCVRHRRGRAFTLGVLMLVRHPSILHYVFWTENILGTEEGRKEDLLIPGSQQG